MPCFSQAVDLLAHYKLLAGRISWMSHMPRVILVIFLYSLCLFGCSSTNGPVAWKSDKIVFSDFQFLSRPDSLERSAVSGDATVAGSTYEKGRHQATSRKP